MLPEGILNAHYASFCGQDSNDIADFLNVDVLEHTILILFYYFSLSK